MTWAVILGLVLGYALHRAGRLLELRHALLSERCPHCGRRRGDQ